MTITEIYDAGIEIQSEIVYCYYDYDKNERVNITRKEASEKEIKWIYAEDNALYIEVDME